MTNTSRLQIALNDLTHCLATESDLSKAADLAHTVHTIALTYRNSYKSQASVRKAHLHVGTVALEVMQLANLGDERLPLERDMVRMKLLHIVRKIALTHDPPSNEAIKLLLDSLREQLTLERNNVNRKD